LLLAIIVRILYETSTSTLVNVLPIINKVTVSLLTVLSAVAFGLYTYDIAFTVRDGRLWYYRDEKMLQDKRYIDFSHTSLYFLVSLFVVVYAVLIYMKEHSQVRPPENHITTQI
jgi:hypothetical protein